VKRLYATQYQAGDGAIHGHQISSTSLRGARHLAGLRGLGEQVVGLAIEPQPTCSQVWMSRKADALERIHAITFLGHLATAVGFPSSVFFDDGVGILHLACHLERDRQGTGLRLHRGQRLAERHREIVARIRKIEKTIPGYGA
jgi:hypothetical protein